MQILFIVPLVFSLVLSPMINGGWNSPDTNARARELAAQFDKSKHKIKDKRNIHIEIRIDVKSEPWLRSAKDYAGTYGGTSGFRFQLAVDQSGQISASGTEPGATGPVEFKLREAKIDGALLTGTKVYADGKTETLEGVFLRRTIKSDQTDRVQILYGLGVVFASPRNRGEDRFPLDRLFYELKSEY